MTTTRDDPAVAVGTVWFVWGDHQTVTAERNGPFGREVRLSRVGSQQREKQPWVEAWRVSKYGEPSTYYSEASR